MADDKPIIIVKKKGGHGGHHGGAWKIAYADFVTAMMCFFLVMWLVNSASVQTRENIASYFRRPGIFQEGSGTPLLLGGAGILEDAFVPPKPEDKRKTKKKPDPNPAPRKSGESDKDLDARFMKDGTLPPLEGRGENQATGLNSNKDFYVKPDKANEIKQVEEIKKIVDKVKKEVGESLNIKELEDALGKLNLKTEEDGLTIEIMDTAKTSMFTSGSAVIRPEAQSAFGRIAEVLKKYPNTIDITGHTDAKPFSSRAGVYSNWELSADRANAARRLLEIGGIPSSQFGSVVGKNAHDLKNKENPLDPSNRRITLKMKFNKTASMEFKNDDESQKALNELLSTTPTPTPEATETNQPAIPTPKYGELDYPIKPTPTPAPTVVQTPKAPEGIIRLPNEPVPTDNPSYMERDKIFEKSPVIGATELFSG